MDKHSSTDRPIQRLKAGRNAVQVGGNYQKTTNFNFVLMIIGILALGGLALGIYVTGSIPNFNNSIEQQTAPAETPINEE